MRHVLHSQRPRVIRQDPILQVDHATMIPDGMHGIEAGYHGEGWRTATMIPTGMHATIVVDKRRVLESVVDGLIARGVEPVRARTLVSRAAMRQYQNQGDGLGDDATPDSSLLTAVQAKAADMQSQHKALIDKLGGGADPNAIRDAVEGLYNDWTAYAVDAAGGVPPVQWDRTDPVQAILIAVRDDLRNTADMLAANKAQQVLAKQIAGLPKLGIPGSLPSLPDVPWYVWAGGAGVGILALKQMFK